MVIKSEIIICRLKEKEVTNKYLKLYNKIIKRLSQLIIDKEQHQFQIKTSNKNNKMKKSKYSTT